MRRMDKEKTTARNCSVGAEQEQSFCIKYTYSISDILSGFNVFFHSHPTDYREEEHNESLNI